MRATIPLSVAVLSLSLALPSCAPPDDPEPDAGGGPLAEAPDPRGPRRGPDFAPPLGLAPGESAASSKIPVAAGWTDGGDVVLFDTGTGHVLATAPGPGLGGERDVAVDPWYHRLIVFESDAADPWGEIVTYPLDDGDDGASLGARQHRVWIDGTARVTGSPFGVVVFEDGYGPRWRLVREDGTPTASVYGPRPASLATALLPDGGFRISALTYGPSGEAADLRVALVGPEGVEAPVTVPLVVTPPSTPPSARWVASAGGGHLVDVAAGDVVISTFAGGGWPPLMPVGVGPGIARVEQAAAFPGGERLALATTGTVDLVIAGIGPGGAPECAAALDLPGDVEEAALFFARGLAVVGPDRVLAATSEGVFAVTVSSGCPPALAVDPGFDGSALRGPIDGVP